MIMHTKYQCSIINTSEDMSQIKVFVTDRQRDRRRSFNVPRFRERRGTINYVIFSHCKRSDYRYNLEYFLKSMMILYNPERYKGNGSMNGCIPRNACVAWHSYAWLPRKCDHWTDGRRTKWFLCAAICAEVCCIMIFILVMVVNCLFNVTINDISVIYVTAHRH